MNHLALDLRFALRSFGRQAGLALAAVLTLALGIGVNTAIFSVVDSVLVTPPPFREPDRVVAIWGSNAEAEAAFGVAELPVSNAIFYDWQREARSFESLAMLQSDRMTLTGQGEPEQIGIVRVAGDFFGVLGTPAVVGRTLEPADDAPGKPTVVVLSHAYWQRRFGGDPKVVGRTLSLNGLPITVVGVMPPRFAFPRNSEVPAGYGFATEPDAWVPFALPIEERENRMSRFSLAIGRLRPGVGVGAAEAELKAICERIAQLHPDSDKGWSAHLVPITEQMVGQIRPMLLVLWAAVGLVLLIACANVANLLFARGASRQREIALRTAIGAGRRQLVTQLLTESLVLSLLGGAVGVALAWAGLRAAGAIVPVGTAGAATFALNGRVLAFNALLCILTALLAGLIPAFQMTRPDLSTLLRERMPARGTSGGGRRRTGSSLVVAEIALAVLLLIGAGLLLRSFVRLLGIDPGFRGDRILTFRIDLPPEQLPPPDRVVFFDRVTQGLADLSGAESAAVISALPLSGIEGFASVHFEGRPLPGAGQMWTVDRPVVTWDYFRAMGIPLRDGRLFRAGDTQAAAQVAVINENMAETYWPGENPVGKRFRFGSPDPAKPWITVVGVVGDVRHTGLHTEPRPTAYQPMAQAPESAVPYYAWVVLRTRTDPEAFIEPARAVVHRVDRNQPLSQIKTMDEVIADSMAPRRFSLLLLGLFALLALVLSIVGVYGITSYSVAQRTREMGLRLALGARPAEVLRMVVTEAGVLAGLGVLLGLAAAFALTRVMASMLFGVETRDPLPFAGVAVGLALVALLAALLPGRRATRVNPMVALRVD